MSLKASKPCRNTLNYEETIVMSNNPIRFYFEIMLYFENILPAVPQAAASTRSRGSLASRRRRARETRRRAAAAPTASWDTAGELTDGGKAEIPRFHRTPAVPTPTSGLTAGRWEGPGERGLGFGCVMRRINKTTCAILKVVFIRVRLLRQD